LAPIPSSALWPRSLLAIVGFCFVVLIYSPTKPTDRVVGDICHCFDIKKVERATVERG
jgi:hypothetical protein